MTLVNWMPRLVRAVARGGEQVVADVEDAVQGLIDDADDAEHDKEVQEHGQTARGGVVAEVLLQAEHLLLLLFRLVFVLFLDLLDHEAGMRSFAPCSSAA